MSERRLPEYSEPVLALMERKDEMITAADIAPIVHMHKDVIIQYAKTGRWDLCEYVISGERVKFSRIDFLRRMGFIPRDARPGLTITEQVLHELTSIRALIMDLIEARKEAGQ